MKYELKIEFKDTKVLLDLIKKSYKNGVLFDKTQKIILEKNTHNYLLCKGLDNLAARLSNEEIIDGSLRFIITETRDTISLYPCSIYCDYENNKYVFSV